MFLNAASSSPNCPLSRSYRSLRNPIEIESVKYPTNHLIPSGRLRRIAGSTNLSNAQKQHYACFRETHSAPFAPSVHSLDSPPLLANASNESPIDSSCQELDITSETKDLFEINHLTHSEEVAKSRVGSPIGRDLSASFRSRKRLPHPVEHRPPPLYLQKPSPDNPPTESSRLSYSKWPLPPNSPGFIESDPQNNHEDSGIEPQTPTTYHLRGISFDIVNPHSSLKLENIETARSSFEEYLQHSINGLQHFPKTPEKQTRPEDWSRFFDYFNQPTMPSRSNVTGGSISEEKNNYESSGKSLQSPKVYDDLGSAYMSITKRPFQGNDSNWSTENLPQPPIPLASREPRARNEDIPSASRPTKEVAKIYEPKHVNNALRTTISNFFKMSKNSIRPPECERPILMDSPTKSMSEGHDAEVNGDIPTLTMDDIEIGRGNQGRNHTVTGLGLQPSSTSFDCLPDSLQQVILRNDAYGHINRHGSLTRDQSSNENLIDIYANGFGQDSPSLGPAYRIKSRKSSPFLNPNTPSTGTMRAESTIGDIIDRYHGNDDSTRASINCQDEHLTRVQPKTLKSVLSGLDQFNFGLHRIDDSDNVLQRTASTHSIDIRTATNRALTAPPRTGPPPVLPPDPSMRHFTSVPHTESSKSSSPSQVTSYGDTQNFLATSPDLPAMNNGKDFATARSVDFNINSQNSLPIPRCHPVGQDTNRCASQPFRKSGGLAERDLEGIMLRDLQHLSALSGLSSFSGSIYVLNNGPVSHDPIDDQDCQQAISLQSSSSMHAESLLLRETQQAPEAMTVPVAAFPRRAFTPGSHRLPIKSRNTLMKDEQDWLYDTIASGLNKEDEQDWETVADSRPTFQNVDDASTSWADCSSYNSLQTSSIFATRPSGSQHEKAYRMSTQANAQGPDLAPTYDFHGGYAEEDAVPSAKLAELEELAELALYTYNNPSPIPFFNPYTWNKRSPRQIEGSLPVPYRNIAIQSGSRLVKRSVLYPTRIVIGNQSYEVSLPRNSSTEARNGSKDDDSEKRMARETNSSSSATNMELIDLLRDDDPRMASTPLSKHNSFAKVSHLGRNKNVTGTPNGTNAQFTGSSLVGSSSPWIPGSSPPVCQDTPQRLKTSSPFAASNHSDPRVSPSQNAGPSLIEIDDDDDLRSRLALARKSSKESVTFREALMSKETRPAMPRTQSKIRISVRGQKELKGIVLAPRNNVYAQEYYSERQSRSAVRSESPDIRLPDRLRPQRTFSDNLPCLWRRHRSPSSLAIDTRDRKTKISIHCFLTCCVVPPLLILFGHGYLDEIAAYVSDGEIQHFSCRWKVRALYVGWGFSVVVVLFLVIFLVCVRTVPNSLPRAFSS